MNLTCMDGITNKSSTTTHNRKQFHTVSHLVRLCVVIFVMFSQCAFSTQFVCRPDVFACVFKVATVAWSILEAFLGDLVVNTEASMEKKSVAPAILNDSRTVLIVFGALLRKSRTM